MIGELKPYAEYKDSGLPWLGQVPAHWQVVRSKRLFSARKELARPDDVQLSATQAYGVIAQSLYEERTGYRVVKISMHLDKRRHVEADDFVISMRSFQGGLERAWSSGAIRSSYVVLKPGPEVDPTYFRHLFKSAPYIGALRGTADFIRDGQDLNYANFCGVDLPLMPRPEQAAIGRYLDWANGRLERAIRAKRKVIALLMEQKRGLVHRAVTEGLQPNAARRASNAPWLGDIPSHWEVVALGRLSVARCDGPFGSGLKSLHYTDSGVRVIRLQNIGNGEYRDRGDAFISAEHYSTLGDHGVNEGDLLIAGLGDEKMPAGRACIAPGTLGRAMVKADCFRFRLQPDRVVPMFLSMHLSATAAAATACLSTGATRLRINLQATAARSVALPPFDEQQRIVAAVEKATEPLNVAITRLWREIDLLREYRARLVADIVTGRFDVRAAAVQLPADLSTDLDTDAGDEVDDTEPIDEEATEA